jgi:hypothetical protein
MCRKLIYLISFVLLMLCLVGHVQAANVRWTDASGDHNWFTAGNWDPCVPTTADIAWIGLLPGPTIVNDVNVVVYRIYIGENNGVKGGLTVDGGTLTVTSTFQLAYCSPGSPYVGSAGTLNMNSGTITMGGGFNLGQRGLGTLNMTGGTITVLASTLNIPESASGIGHMNLDGGIITVKDFKMRPTLGGIGTMDIGGGTLIINGDKLSRVQGYIDSGWITAYGGSGQLSLNYDTTKTTLTATGYRFNLNPANRSTVSTSLDKLQWTLPTSSTGGIVTCDVWFGTNPDIESNPKVVIRQAVESVSVTLAPLTTYYWAIDLYDSNINGGTVRFYLSPIFTFNAVSNLPPTVNAGDDVATWLVNGLRVVQLNGSASDDGKLQPITFLWTVIAEPNELNPAQISDSHVANPTVTVRELGSYTLQLEAYDGEFTVTDTMQIAVYADSCEHAQKQGGFAWLAGDINHDCKIDLLDLADLAASWLQKNYSIE